MKRRIQNKKVIMAAAGLSLTLLMTGCQKEAGNAAEEVSTEEAVKKNDEALTEAENTAGEEAETKNGTKSRKEEGSTTKNGDQGTTEKSDLMLMPENGNGKGFGGQMPQMGQMPDGEMPDFSQMPQMGQFAEGETPDFSQMPQMGQFPGFAGQDENADGNTQDQRGFGRDRRDWFTGQGEDGQTDGFQGGMQGFAGGQMGQMGQMSQNVTIASEPTEIVTTTQVCTAALLSEDLSEATTIVMSEDNNTVKIEAAGTYVITGTCSDGSITVKKGTTGVVLVLKDLTLTSTSGAPVSVNKGAEAKIVIEGTVNLTDAENPDDETSTDAEVADAFDGAAIKVKDGANVLLCGTGTLNIDASSCKNGIKSGDDAATCLVIDGDLTINIKAANDAINAGYDLTILSGTFTISAGDDAIHADRILTIGQTDGSGPNITITSCEEGLEGSVVNLFGGNTTLSASDDGINAANSDKTYASEMAFSINMTGGTWNVTSKGDGLDSNGNINLIVGTVTIKSTYNGGEAGIDYDGSYYVSDEAVINNESGVAGPDNFGGMGGRR